MYTEAIPLAIFIVCCLLVKYLFWSDALRKLYFFYISKRCSSVEEKWKEARARREEWETQNPYAPSWHRERQELLRVELGAFMIFVDKGPRFSDAILQHRARDLETLAAEIVDEDDVFQNQPDKE